MISVQNSEPAPVKLSYSIPEVVAATSIKRGLIYENLRTGALIHKKVGTRTIILREDLVAWLTALENA